jgi:putative glycosyltransferase (TIGR04372 family)
MFETGVIQRFLNQLNRIVVAPIVRVIFVKLDLNRKFRFLNTNSSAIGHLCLDVDTFIKEAALKKFNFIGILLANKNTVANQVIARIWASNQYIYVISSPFLCFVFDYLRTYSDTSFDCSIYCALRNIPSKSHDIYRAHTSNAPVAVWPSDLYAEARSLFERVFPGVNVERLVVLHSRDSVYDLQNRNANYFSSQHRNSDISSYTEILHFLRKREFIIIRIGEYEFNDNLDGELFSRIPQLPKFEVDLINAYIASECSLFLGCNSGALMMPTIWNRPIFLLNFLPYDSLRQYASNCMSIPKLLSINGKILGAKVIFDNGYHKFDLDSQYKAKGIDINNNCAYDCLEDFQEFFRAFVDGDEALQAELRESIEKKEYTALSPQDCFDKHAAGLIPRNFFRTFGIV